MGLLLADKVSLARCIVLEDDLPLFWKTVLDLGLVCAEDRHVLFSMDDMNRSVDLQDSLHSLDVLESRIEALCRLMGISFSEIGLLRLDEMGFEDMDSILDLVAKINMDLNKLETNVMEVVSAIEDKKQFIFENVQIAWFISVLLHSGIRNGDELDLDLVSVFLGTIPRDGVEQLEVAFNELDVAVEFESTSRGRVMVIVVGKPNDRDAILGILQAGSFIGVDFSCIDSRSLIELGDEIEEKVWEAREEISDLNLVLSKKKEVFKVLLMRLLSWIRLEKSVLSVLVNSNSGDGVWVVDLWVRDEDKDNICNRLMNTLENRLFVEFLDVDRINILPSEVPAKFSVPHIFSPFFELVKMYGYPAYDEFNPTVFFAPAFVIMYGMMFADVGHGLVLVLLGWLFRRSRLFFILAILCGISSSFFGWLFGSIFGREDIISPIWVSPLHNPIAVMELSIIFGVSYIGLGMLFFALKHIRKRDFKKAVFGEWGIASLSVYLGLPVILLSHVGVKIKLTLVALLIIGWIWGIWHEEHDKGIEEKIMAPFEIGLSLFSNTVSFVRLAAFAINHAALMIVVYVIASLLKNLMLSGVMVILGNVFVIGLEAMLVMIQCLRLQYYEFFSKFYLGEGRQFIPLLWNVS